MSLVKKIKDVGPILNMETLYIKLENSSNQIINGMYKLYVPKSVGFEDFDYFIGISGIEIYNEFYDLSIYNPQLYAYKDNYGHYVSGLQSLTIIPRYLFMAFEVQEGIENLDLVYYNQEMLSIGTKVMIQTIALSNCNLSYTNNLLNKQLPNKFYGTIIDNNFNDVIPVNRYAINYNTKIVGMFSVCGCYYYNDLTNIWTLFAISFENDGKSTLLAWPLYSLAKIASQSIVNSDYNPTILGEILSTKADITVTDLQEGPKIFVYKNIITPLCLSFSATKIIVNQTDLLTIYDETTLVNNNSYKINTIVDGKFAIKKTGISLVANIISNNDNIKISLFSIPYI